MQNLQELYDFYVSTRPSLGKLQSASRFLIHVCNALEVNSADEISIEQMPKIPAALDKFYHSNLHTSIQDKGILAEMIGRYGPVDGLEKVVQVLLNDRDDNLRQFTLQTLGYTGCKYIHVLISYFEKFRQSDKPVMRKVTIQVIARILSQQDCPPIKEKLLLWGQEEIEFVRAVYDFLQDNVGAGPEIIEWFIRNFPDL